MYISIIHFSIQTSVEKEIAESRKKSIKSSWCPRITRDTWTVIFWSACTERNRLSVDIFHGTGNCHEYTDVAREERKRSRARALIRISKRTTIALLSLTYHASRGAQWNNTLYWVFEQVNVRTIFLHLILKRELIIDYLRANENH